VSQIPAVQAKVKDQDTTIPIVRECARNLRSLLYFL
jgi:hypothetical protein